jgi:hypothetical protein
MPQTFPGLSKSSDSNQSLIEIRYVQSLRKITIREKAGTFCAANRAPNRSDWSARAPLGEAAAEQPSGHHHTDYANGD